MAGTKILLPSQPKIIKEEGNLGIYEVDGLYPGYGHTLGNSLRRIILSSIEGVAITSLKIKGVNHEFSTIDGVKEDVVTIILNLKKLRFKILSDEAQTVSLSIKGPKVVTGGDFKLPGQVEIMNADQYVCEVTDKNTELVLDIEIQKGLGYVSKEMIQKERVEIGAIAVDALFSPIRRVSYEVENMRVGNRTDFNRLKISIESDGSVTPRIALETSIATMINQLRAIVGFKEEDEEPLVRELPESPKEDKFPKEDLEDVFKTRIESLDLSQRTINALINANIRTVGGLARKKEKDLGEIDGLGAKGVQEIKNMLKEFSIELK
jgi:DNA-directed RNA polymerase subunit alpha